MKLSGFAIKKRHIACMKSCVNDIYWQKCSQSPRAVADCCRFSSLNDKGATNFDPYSCHFFINNYEQSQRYFQWSSYSHFASHWAGAVVALNILRSSEFGCTFEPSQESGQFLSVIVCSDPLCFFLPFRLHQKSSPAPRREAHPRRWSDPSASTPRRQVATDQTPRRGTVHTR